MTGRRNWMPGRRATLRVSLVLVLLVASLGVMSMSAAAEEADEPLPVTVEETLTVTAILGTQVCVEASGTVSTDGPVCTPGEVSATLSIAATADADVVIVPSVELDGSTCLTADIGLTADAEATVAVTVNGEELLNKTVSADADADASVTVCASVTLG